MVRRRRPALKKAFTEREDLMTGVVNIEKCFEKFSDLFSPKIVGELNGQHVKLVRLEGDRVPLHTHEGEDELFLVLDGELKLIDNSREMVLHAGEFYIVRRGREHRVIPHGHVKLLLFEPAGIEHTGKVRSEITKERFDRLDP
jgi:mannose-6-phosphate isomerase-like protein (cupin superfamily)